MSDLLPKFVVQGETARLFPVLSTTSKEGRATAILLACIGLISELGIKLLGSLGQRVGKRANLMTYTEIVLKSQPNEARDRPDGLIVLRVGAREWRALIESKIGNANLSSEQIERYRVLAKDNQVDCVVTISNQFATHPTSHPLEEVRKSRSKVPVFHWSWMHILTTVELLISSGEVKNRDQLMILNELRRFLTHESTGVKGFDRMPKEWTDLNKLVSSGGAIPARSPEAITVVEAWHQETRDLSLILTRMTEERVSEKLPKKHAGDPAQRQKDELAELRDRHRLVSMLEIPDAAAPVEVVADIMRRSIDVGMTLRAPQDKKSTKARLNWLLRQIKSDNVEDLHVRLFWPGSSESTQFPVSELRANMDICEEGKKHLTPRAFHVFLSKRLGARFTQQSNFIADLEAIVPEFYGRFGSRLAAWKKSAPKIKETKSSPEDVSTEAISDEAADFEPQSIR